MTEQVLYGKEHVDRYLATDGKEGYRWRNGTSILLLFTRGRKSGNEHASPLIYRDWGDGAYLVVASKGGAPEPPDWYLNLKADPDEQADMWKRMVEVWPAYEEYQKKTDRQIPVVVLERTELV
jgi:hypothetical protein